MVLRPNLNWQPWSSSLDHWCWFFQDGSTNFNTPSPQSHQPLELNFFQTRLPPFVSSLSDENFREVEASQCHSSVLRLLHKRNNCCPKCIQNIYLTNCGSIISFVNVGNHRSVRNLCGDGRSTFLCKFLWHFREKQEFRLPNSIDFPTPPPGTRTINNW